MNLNNVNDNDGRKIKAVFWQDTDTEKSQFRYSNEKTTLIFSSSYHGDSDEH